MKTETIVGIGGFFALLIFLFILMFSIRWFNNAATKIVVHDVEENVQCALATSNDGVAIDCWRTD